MLSVVPQLLKRFKSVNFAMNTKENFKLKMTNGSMAITASFLAIMTFSLVAMDYLGNNNQNQAFAQANATTANDNKTNSENVTQQQQQALAMYPANFTRATGSISNIQNNDAGEPEWILSGQWDLAIPSPLKINQTNPPNAAAFNAAIEMIKTDGTAGHIHTISDFKLNEGLIRNNNLALSGTATISMSEEPIENVPISINVANQGSIIMGIDPVKTNNHFGNENMYGTVNTIGTFLTFP